MRRRATMLLALPVLVHSLVASAQSKPAEPAAPASTAAPPPAPTPPPAGADSTATSAPAGSAGTATSVSVDMSTKSPGDQAMTGATYSVRLRDLEQRVDELKDQIRRSHTRLALLSDTIIGGGAVGSRAEIDFKNEMSSAFELIRALFVVDGQVQYNRQDDSGALADQKDIPVYSGSVPPGDHTIQVALQFQGNGFGVFSYLRGYKFEVKSSHSFTAMEGKTISVTATAFEKGGVTTPLEQRPTMEWREKLQPLGAGVSAGGGAPAAAPPAPAAAGGANVSGGVSVGGGKK